jgi:hypothetical protein
LTIGSIKFSLSIFPLPQLFDAPQRLEFGRVERLPIELIDREIGFEDDQPMHGIPNAQRAFGREAADSDEAAVRLVSYRNRYCAKQ